MKGRFRLLFVVVFIFSITPSLLYAQHSVARKWSEMLLFSIRNDRARPPVHARNLFHVSAAMYDAWAAYDETAVPWLLNNSRGEFFVPFTGVASPTDVEQARTKAISYAAYRVIIHRFNKSPGFTQILSTANNLMAQLGYNPNVTSIDYSNGDPASLGNFIAKSYIEFGLQDGSNETGNYGNLYYVPVNPPLIMKDPGNPFIIEPNRWQPLMLETFVDQSGNVVPGGAANFIGAEWGNVIPFSLSASHRINNIRDDHPYPVYHDPGPPPLIQADGGGMSQYYKWGFVFVSKWSSHLDQNDGVMWDISPASIGNVTQLPTTFEELVSFYDDNGGGDQGTGRSINPKTGKPYTPQIVPRGDYTRVLAEFWADGPESETPPGHWFTILNTVMDYPGFEKKFKGVGEVMNDLEWDVRAYLTLGGSMHDVAIAAWGVKGWYDYVRPVSAIRCMAREGQSSDPAQPRYTPKGIPLSTGFVEMVKAGDPLAGANNENVDKIKIKAWKGPSYVTDPTQDHAGVDWILAENWWPYQRPTFVTPPFAGYVSGHSTYSRAAAEVMTLLTGDEYFPGGMSEFRAPKDQYLVFEKGPSVDVTLQWATYRDASDQCSLSRIWGGIHPPQDDMPGRIMGRDIGINAFGYAEKFFEGVITSTTDEHKKADENFQVYPNPVKVGQLINFQSNREAEVQLTSPNGVLINDWKAVKHLEIGTTGLAPGLYFIKAKTDAGIAHKKLILH